MSNTKHTKQFKTHKAFQTALNKDGIQFTSRIGHIEASPAELVRLFGKPVKSDGYKVSGEYMFKIWEHFITLYDWKATSLYDHVLPSPKDYWANEERVIFNVGSQGGQETSDTIYLLLELIQAKRIEAKRTKDVPQLQVIAGGTLS